MKENNKDIFNNEALDDELLVQTGSIAKELKGSIFTPKIVEGPRIRKSLNISSSSPPHVNQGRSVPLKAKDANKNDARQQKATKGRPKATTKSKRIEPTADEHNEDEEEEDDDESFSQSKSMLNRPAVIPSVVAVEMPTMPSSSLPIDPVDETSPVGKAVVEMVHEINPAKASAATAKQHLSSQNEIPVLVDVHNCDSKDALVQGCL